MTQETLSKKNKTRTSSGMVFFVFIFILLTLLALAVTAFNYKQINDLTDIQNSNINVPNSSVREIKQLLTNDQGALQSQQTQAAELSKQLALVQQQIGDLTPQNKIDLRAQNRKLALHVKTMQHTLLQLYLQWAQTLLLTQQDPTLALQMLSQASDITQMTHEEAEHKNIMTAMQQVSKLPAIDTNATLLKLKGLNAALTSLRFTASTGVDSNPVSCVRVPSWWHRQLCKVQQLVTIHDDPTLSQGLLTNADRLNATRTIQMWLDSAADSAVRHDQGGYDLALQHVLADVSQWTEGDDNQKIFLRAVGRAVAQPVGYTPAQLKLSIDPIQKALQSITSTELSTAEVSS